MTTLQSQLPKYVLCCMLLCYLLESKFFLVFGFLTKRITFPVAAPTTAQNFLALNKYLKGLFCFVVIEL